MKTHAGLRNAYDDALTRRSVRRYTAEADREDTPFGTTVSQQELATAVTLATWQEDDGSVNPFSRAEKILFTQGFAQSRGNADAEALAFYDGIVDRYDLDEAALLTAPTPHVLEDLDPAELEGALRAYYDETETTGEPTGRWASQFQYKGRTYQAVNVNGEFSRAMAIGTPTGKIRHTEEALLDA